MSRVVLAKMKPSFHHVARKVNMRFLRSLQPWMVGLALIHVILPGNVLRAAEGPSGIEEPAPPAVLTRDIDLGRSQQLRGQLVNRDGKPLANQRVVAIQGDSTPMQTTTDRSGRFVFVGLKAGLYQVQAEHGLAMCRCWSDRTAPPAAVNELLLVSDAQAVRGQRPFAEILSGPILIGLIIAAAIAIPIAIHESQDSAS
jgi:hypothetical protein